MKTKKVDAFKAELINTIMKNKYGGDDSKYDEQNLKFLESLSTDELANLADASYLNDGEEDDNVPAFMKKIDWIALRKQKACLLDVIFGVILNDANVQGGTDELQGILELLDAIQDYAADDMELGEKIVFGNEI